MHSTLFLPDAGPARCAKPMTFFMYCDKISICHSRKHIMLTDYYETKKTIRRQSTRIPGY